MKLRFRRVIAMVLVAMMLTGVFPVGSVYAGDDETEGSYTLLEEVDKQNGADTSADTPLADPDENETPDTPSSAETDPTKGTNETEGEPKTEETDVTEEEPKTEGTNETEGEPKTEGTDVTEETEQEATVDVSALVAYISQDPSLLNDLYAEDDDVITTLAAVLAMDEDTMRTYAKNLAAQNTILVLALEAGTNVLTVLSDEDADAAAAALCVDPVAIELFSIKLGYLSDQISQAMDEAEDDGYALWQEFEDALTDDEILSSLADQYEVEPAVLAALLQAMGVEPIVVEMMATGGTYIGFTHSKSLYFSQKGSIPAFGVLPVAEFNSSSAAERLANEEVAYCFNYSYHIPFNYETSGGGTCAYTKIENATAAQFADAAVDETLGADAFYKKIISVGLNGYPHDYSGYNNGAVSDDVFRALTQYAIWYYTDNIQMNT